MTVQVVITQRFICSRFVLNVILMTFVYKYSYLKKQFLFGKHIGKLDILFLSNIVIPFSFLLHFLAYDLLIYPFFQHFYHHLNKTNDFNKL